MYASKIFICIIIALLQTDIHVNAATTLSATSGAVTSFGTDLVVAATIDNSVAGTFTITLDFGTPVAIGSVVVVASASTTLTPETGLDARYSIVKTSDTVITVTIKAIATTDDGILLNFDSTNDDEDETFTIDAKTGFSPLVQYVVFGADLAVTATIPVDQTQTIAVAHVLNPSVPLASIGVVPGAATAAEKVVVTVNANLDSTKYSIVETTDQTVTIIIKSIATADDGTDITFTSDVGSNVQDATYKIYAKTTFSPASLTTGTVGSDFVITVTMSVAADHVTSLAYFNGNIKTEVATLTVVAANAAASKLTVTADADLDATEFAIAKATDTTVTLTLKTYAEADSYSVFLFDSAVNNQDAVFVIGGASSLTCGFSILLALAVVLREFMSA